MVDRHSMGSSLQLVRARFSNFFLRELSHEFKLCRMSILHKFQMAIFPSFPNGWGYSHMVRHAGSPVCIAHADMTLTWSKVKVTDLLKFRKLHFSASISSSILACSSKLVVDYDSMGPNLQLFGARFLNFSTSWQSRDFWFREVLTSPEFTAFYLHTGWG